MKANKTCRKHNIHNRQASKQHKTKTQKQHDCKLIKKNTHTQKTHRNIDKHSLRERWEKRLGTVSGKSYTTGLNQVILILYM